MVANPELPPVVLAPETDEERTLAYFLARLVARTPDKALAASVIIGVLGAAAVLIWLPGWSRALSPFGILIAFGTWGIARRESGRSGLLALIVASIRVLALIVGAASVIALTVVLFEIVVGKLIS